MAEQPARGDESGRLEERPMTHDKLPEIQAELERQNEQLAEFEDALKRIDGVDVPPSFFAEFDETCELRPAATSGPTTMMFPAGIRA
jgi:hypothetical protein